MKALPKKNPLFHGASVTRITIVAVIAAAVVPSIWAVRASELLASTSAKSSGRQIEQVLRNAVEQKKVPGVVAMVSRGDQVIYEGASGKRDGAGNTPMTVDSIFRIASMTKPITSVAVMQLVESGRVKLDEPAATYLPELAEVQVLDDLDANTGKAKLRPPKTRPTVRQLLTHTSGFVYEFFDPQMHAYVATGAVPSSSQGSDGFLKAPLLFDPGSRWEYGISTDWLGKLVERVAGQSLEDYFRQHIFEPLGMKDTFFNAPAAALERLVSLHQRSSDGTLLEVPRKPVTSAKFFSGGGGLYSTAGDYLKFTRMLLGGGRLGKARVLQSPTVGEMARNQIGALTLVQLRSLAPQRFRDPLRIPGSLDKFGLGFGINTKPVDAGRSAGSLAWAGAFNTFFWIDPSRRTCAVMMMQTLPFSDDAAFEVFAQFERAVYETLAEAPPISTK